MNLRLLLLIPICLFLASCDPKDKPPTLDTHKVISPVFKNTTYSHEYVSEIHSVRFVEIRSKVRGFIEKIHVDEGQAVKEGQLLFTLSKQEFEKELQKANAAHKKAIADLKATEVELKNVRLLAEKNIVSKAELEVTKAKVEALIADIEEAHAHKEQAALNIAFSRIKAPFSGTINRIPNKGGSLIAEGDMLTSMSDNQEIFAYFNLSEIDYLNYIESNDQETKVVNLKLANNTLYGHHGKVEMIESEFDRSTGNIAFRARFPNPDGILKHGSNAKVVIRKPLHNAMLVPQKSTFEIQDMLYVYVVDKDGVLKQRNVVPKMRFPDFYVVESGLSADEKIVYEGVENVKDGQTIKPEKADLAELMSLSSKP
jgi:membrane fusion protein (multidrug efflux system)